MYTLYIANKNYSSWSLRPWLALTALGIEFTEETVPFDDHGSWHKFRAFSPTGLVPCLHHTAPTDTGGAQNPIVVWDSMAIIEHIAESHPTMWPSDPHARAWARSASAEMHAGFHALREHCPMTIGQRVRLHEHPQALEGDLRRLNELWCEGLNKFGGPFLAGSNFTAVDAFYAPVATRLKTYHLEVSDPAMHYMEHILRLPAMQTWIQQALSEPYREASHEIELAELGECIEDLRAPVPA